MSEQMKYKCPCCGNETMDEEPPGTFQICEVCGWEDDRYQFEHPKFAGGANELSLEQAREQYWNQCFTQDMEEC